MSYIVKQGFSPFLKVVDGRNAFMGAVEGGQTQIVKYIIGLQFHPSSEKHVSTGKQCKDKDGNTALHMSYKNMNGEIHKLLMHEQVGGRILSRNRRGLAPPQMNHKRVEHSENYQDYCDTDPDYLFVVKKNREAFLEKQL